MLSCQRDLFHLPEGLHYLNCAYMSPLLKRVEEAGIAGVRRRRQYCRELTRGLRGEARALGYTLEDEAWCGAHLFGIRLPRSLDLPRLQQLLRERRVFVSVRGDAVRVSPNVYNDPADVQALADVLRAAVS